VASAPIFSRALTLAILFKPFSAFLVALAKAIISGMYFFISSTANSVSNPKYLIY
jgi:hypothetical protein